MPFLFVYHPLATRSGVNGRERERRASVGSLDQDDRLNADVRQTNVGLCSPLDGSDLWHNSPQFRVAWNFGRHLEKFQWHFQESRRALQKGVIGKSDPSAKVIFFLDKSFGFIEIYHISLRVKSNTIVTHFEDIFKDF